MKKNLLLYTFVLHAFFLFAQTRTIMIDRLVTEELLRVDQTERYRELLPGHAEPRPIDYIQALTRVHYERIIGRKFSGLHINIGRPKLDADQQQALNTRLKEYLQKLHRCGLVSLRQLSKQSIAIDDGAYQHALQFLTDAGFRALREEQLAPETLRAFADVLAANGISTEEQIRALHRAIDNYEIEHPFNLLDFCAHATTLSGEDFKGEPADYLQAVHRNIAGLLSELAFTDFDYEVRVEEPTDYGAQSENIRVTLRSGDTTFWQETLYRTYIPRLEDYTPVAINRLQYYQIFNKILAHRKTPYRLHLVSYILNYNTENDRVGIMALTQEQVESLNRFYEAYLPYQLPYFDLSHEEFSQPITSAQIDSALAAYAEIGLFDHLSEAEIAAGRERAIAGNPLDYNAVLACFPRTVLTFDTELGNLEDPYAQLLRDHATISRGAFAPSEVTDHFPIQTGDTAELRFTFRRQPYLFQFRIQNDWIDSDFFSVPNQVLEEHAVPGHFYTLYSDGQEALRIFLTSAQHDYLRAHRLAIFPGRGE